MPVTEKRMFERIPNMFVVLNFVLVSCYLVIPDTARFIFDWYSSIGLTEWPCARSWGNASLAYRNVLYVSAPQTMVFIVAGALYELILFRRRSDPGAFKKLRPLPVVLIGILMVIVWFCVLGNDVPITRPGELGTYNEIIFNRALGVLIVTTLGASLGVEIGRAIGILIYGKS